MKNAVLFLALLGAGGCNSLWQGERVETIKVFVHASPVVRADLSRTLRLTGAVQAGRSVALLPEVAGKVKELPYQVGEHVASGEVVARLDVDLLALQVAQAEAGVKLAQIGVETAEKAYERSTALREKGSLTPQQWEQAEAGLNMARLQADQARAGMGLAKHQLNSSILRAPFDGQVGQIAVEEGSYYSPMAASPYAPGLVTLVDLSQVKVDLQVVDRDVTRIAVGTPARLWIDAVRDRLPPEGLLGTVSAVGVSADPASRTFPVRVIADNIDGAVLAGTHARVDLVLETRPGVLVVPEAAVLGTDEAPYLLALQGGVAKRIPVKVGLRGDQGVEVEGALQEGDLVGIKGHFGLEDGAAVEVVP